MNICSTEKEYLDQIIEPVRRCCKRYGYLPSVLIAQSCLENGYGIPSYWDNPQISALMKYNNMVGIKTELLNKSWSDIGLSVWGGKSISKKTPEEYNGKMVTITDSFRVYDSIEQSFADYLCFMTWASNYGANGEPKYGSKVLKIKDPETLIKKVSSLGYATGSTYPTSVMRIVKKHNLTQYDDLTGVSATKYYPSTKPKITSVAQALKKLGINLIDRIAQNASQVPAHNANTHEYFAVHYLGVVGENPDLYGGGYGGHFYVSKTGQVYQAALPTDKLWHVGASSGFSYIHPTARNSNTVGVECATFTASGRNNDSETWYFTEETQVAAAKLAASFLYVYGLDMSRLLRHGDITTKNCPSPYKRDEGKGTNWTWKKFRTKVAEYYNQLGGDTVVEVEATPTTSYTLSAGDKGDNVKKLQEQLMLAGFAGCGAYLNKAGFVTGVYDSTTLAYVKRMQTAAKISVDGIYGPKSQAALAEYVKDASNVSVDFTVEEMLAKAKTVAANNKKNGFTYGDALCLPSVSATDKVTSCDRFVDQVLYACGMKDIGNRSVTDVAKYLASKGAKKITDVNAVQAGDIMFSNVTGPHTFILGHKVSNGVWERYDSGSKYRIKLTGAYAGYTSQPFKEGLAGFQYAYRLPFKTENKTSGTSDKTSDKTSAKKTVYRVQAGAYSIKANAEKMVARIKETTDLAVIIKDYGASVKDRYSVQLGEFEIKANAAKKQKQAEEQGIKTIIRTVKI